MVPSEGKLVGADQASRGIRVGICLHHPRESKLVAEAVLPSGADVLLGANAEATFVVPHWTGPTLLLLSGGTTLHLGPGMGVRMGERGRLSLSGTFDELVARGVPLPIHVEVSNVNIRVSSGVSVFLQYLNASEPPQVTQE